jgi:hypothetical protein
MSYNNAIKIQQEYYNRTASHYDDMHLNLVNRFLNIRTNSIFGER